MNIKVYFRHIGIFAKEKLIANEGLKKVLGVLLVLIGFTALVTPLTPGSWLIFIGFELLGIGVLKRFWKRKDPH